MSVSISLMMSGIVSVARGVTWARLMLSVSRSEKLGGVEVGHLAQALAGLADGADDLVLHVGNIHDVGDSVAFVFEVAAQQVFEGEGPQVADVGKVIDRRPAGVHADTRRRERNEIIFLSGQRVEEFHISIKV